MFFVKPEIGIVLVALWIGGEVDDRLAAVPGNLKPLMIVVALQFAAEQLEGEQGTKFTCSLQ